MYPFSGICGQFRRLITRYLDITSTAMLVTFLTIVCLAALVTLSNSSCNPPLVIPTPPSNTRPAPTPTDIPTPTITPTPVLTLLPSVTLVEPEADVCVECGSELTLCWNSIYELLANEYYRLRVWANEQELSVFYHKEKCFTLPNLSPGEYKWAVAIVRSATPDIYEQVSTESKWRHFHILPPPPVVHSISPTNTLRGRSVPVVISGENFTYSLALTIGIPVQATFVNSTTITATIPTTLAVGEYSVVVQGSNGGVVSSTVSFTVREPIVSPPATRLWNPQTPVPTASPGYNPSLACVVTPCAPAPQLDGPDDGAELKADSKVEFRWTWAYCLPPGWKFAMRLSAEDPPHSWQYIDDPAYVSCQGGMSIVHYPIRLDPEGLDRLTTIPGTYYWNIAVSRSAVEGWERLSAVSKTCSFTVK